MWRYGPNRRLLDPANLRYTSFAMVEVMTQFPLLQTGENDARCTDKVTIGWVVGDHATEEVQLRAVAGRTDSLVVSVLYRL